MDGETRWRWPVLALTTVSILAATLAPVRDAGPVRPGDCCLTIDVIANVLLFLPFGAALGLFGLTVPAAVGTGALVSALIELTQRWIPGRSPALHDVVTNAVGTLVGVAVLTGWGRRDRWWPRVGRALAAVVIVSSVAASHFVEPASPAPKAWFGWAGEPRGPTRFDGRVLEFRVQGIDVPNGPFPEPATLAARIAGQDPIHFNGRIVSGPPGSGRALLAGISGETGTDYLSLWQEDRSLLGFMRLRLEDIGLRTAWIRLDNAFPATAGDTIDVSATVHRSRVILATHWHASRSEGVFQHSPALFWVGLLPFEVEIGAPMPGWSFLLLGIVFVGLGAGIRTIPGLVASAVLGLWLGPILTGAALPAFESVIAAAVGAGVGRVIATSLGLWNRANQQKKAVRRTQSGGRP